MKISIGFTGTRNGMSDVQLDEISKYLAPLLDTHDSLELHHGDCVGADMDMHDMFLEMCINTDTNFKIHIHPPVKNGQRAFCDAEEVDVDWLVTYEPKPYLERDYDIVDACDILLATPKSLKEERRSGTWATIRYARKTNKKHKIFG